MCGKGGKALGKGRDAMWRATRAPLKTTFPETQPAATCGLVTFHLSSVHYGINQGYHNTA
jgi:hypothetical protein